MSGWGMMSWFGGGAAATKKKDAPKNAILQLRGTLEMLSKREKHLQHQMEEQDALARKYVSSNKPAAKAALRRKKGYETSLEQTNAQMITLEREINNIETANINKETFDAMQNASGAMKQIHSKLTADKVDQAMEELRDQHALSEEINEALTQGAVSSGALDEDELESELDQLQQEELDNKMLKAGDVPIDTQAQRIPSIGNTNAPVQTEEDEEEELRKLQAEMAM